MLVIDNYLVHKYLNALKRPDFVPGERCGESRIVGHVRIAGSKTEARDVRNEAEEHQER
jgi:hypothetical protein